MQKYLAVLGRQPLLSLAELESLFEGVRLVHPELAEFETQEPPQLRRLGGTLKLAEPIAGSVVDFLKQAPEGKITLGVSDFSKKANPYAAQKEALRLKRLLVKAGRSVRVVPNQKSAVLSSATSFHNRLFTESNIELIKLGGQFYRVIDVQDIDAYVRRDQARPARDAKVGMLPPKLAQILINLCGPLPAGTTLLDPFCGTGVVLQEATLMGYIPYGTDLHAKMVEYSRKNLDWLTEKLTKSLMPNRGSAPDASIVAQVVKNVKHKLLEQGDATNYRWAEPVGAVACETYLGRPMSLAPAEIKLKQEKQECSSIILGFLRNLADQIPTDTPVVIAVPAWLRPDGHYERLNFLDEIQNLGYNVKSFKNLGPSDLLYHREGQVVAREIIVLRKK